MKFSQTDIFAAATQRNGYEIYFTTVAGHTLAAQLPDYPGTIFLLVGPDETVEQAIAWALDAARSGGFKTREEWRL